MTEILVIKPSSVGDILHGLQVAQSIRDQAPDSRITWVVRDRFAPLVETCATVDEVLLFHRGRGAAAFLRLLRDIRARHYDLVLDFRQRARSAAATPARAPACSTASARPCPPPGVMPTPSISCSNSCP
jgi:ADP-heptose:LPS heptosyltransferase